VTQNERIKGKEAGKERRRGGRLRAVKTPDRKSTPKGRDRALGHEEKGLEFSTKDIKKVGI